MAEYAILQNKVIGFIGGGNMAQAIGVGLLRAEIIKPCKLWVSSRTEKTLSVWKHMGVNTTFKNYEVILESDIIFLAMKPQVFEEALRTCPLPGGKHKGKLFISVMVGVTLDFIYERLDAFVDELRVIRSMPNTPVLVSEGIIVYCSKKTNEEDEEVVKLLFSQLGMCEKIPEALINSAGALTGSGPAYAYLIIEALSDGALKKGIPRALATRFAAQVLVGAGKTVLETEKHPGQLKDEVCSPNGTTITGIHALEKSGVRAAMMNAIEAAVSRSDELTKSIKS